MRLVDITMFWSDEGGGVQRYLRAKSDYFDATGDVHHTIVVPGTLLADAPRIPGIPLPFGAGYRIPRDRASVRRVLRALAPDVIEAGDPYQLAWAALRAGQQSGVPVTAFYHSDLPELAARALGDYGRRAARTYVRNLYSRFDRVFAPSQHVAQRLADLGISRVRLQPLGVDTRIFHPRRRFSGWRAQLGISPNMCVLLYVGRYAPEKNLQVLCDAIDRLGAPYWLVTIGGGPKPPVGSRLTLLPYESDPSRLARAYASADLLVHAGDEETFGLAVLEAMACGLPVVGSAYAGVGELIDASVGAKVSACTANAYAEAIHDMASRDLAGLAHQCRLRACAYDWSHVLAGLSLSYHELVGKHEISRPSTARRAA